jgi:hypothetical protein
MTKRKLSALIKTGTAISRSISLERDEGDADTLHRYHITAKALEVLKRFTSGLTGEPITAWSITGPYGMGKSSFVNFLLALCGPKNTAETNLAMNMLNAVDVDFAKQLHDAICLNNLETRGFLRIPITASFNSVHGTLAKGLKRAITKTKIQTADKKGLSDLIGTLDKILKQTNRNDDSKTLLECFRFAAKLHGGPIVLVIDEFGKNLEFMARYPDKGDLFIMQELAEAPEIFLFVCLHLAFDTYVAGFSMRQLQEWGKIQGRFEDISFVETRQQMVGFIQSSLQRENTPTLSNNLIENWANDLYQTMKNLNIPHFKGWTSDDVSRLYPIHPLAAVILPELCIRFAQSDRTLFAFLCGGEPNALPAYLSAASLSEKEGSLPTFGPEYLYDYFLASANSVTSNRPEARRWIEVNDLIHKSRHLASHQLKLIKLIGLLNLISSSVGLRASKALLAFGLIKPFSEGKQSAPVASEILSTLQESGITLYREYADEYRLWEGTDFDIPKATAKLKALIKPLPLHEVLQATLPLTPLTASRHSYESGALRHFERRWVISTALNETPPGCSADEADGLILYCLGKDVAFKPSHSVTQSGKPLVLVYANFEEQVQDLVLEAAAAQRLLTLQRYLCTFTNSNNLFRRCER